MTSQKGGNSERTRIGDSGHAPSHVDGPHNTTACIIRMKRDKVYVHKHVPCVLHLYTELYHSVIGRGATWLTVERDRSRNMKTFSRLEGSSQLGRTAKNTIQLLERRQHLAQQTYLTAHMDRS